MVNDMCHRKKELTAKCLLFSLHKRTWLILLSSRFRKEQITVLIPEQGSGLANYTVKWTLFSVSPNSLCGNTFAFLSSFKAVP